MFSKTCEYALKIMIYLCSVKTNKKRAGLKDIAEAIASPEAFTAKILQQLVRSKLLHSLRGPTGGFELRKDPITLLEVVAAIDGDGVIKHCVLGLEKCSDSHPCPVHETFVKVRNQLAKVLASTFLSDINAGVIKGNSYLKL